MINLRQEQDQKSVNLSNEQKLLNFNLAMKNIKKSIFISFILFNLICCSNMKPTIGDIAGIWKSKDGAIISFFTDGTCYVKDIYLTKILPMPNMKLVKKKISFNGFWDYNKPDKLNNSFKVTICNQKILKPEQLINNSTFIEFTFEIKGKGMFQNKPPWYLVKYIGDPDDMNFYEFFKEQTE